MDTMSTAFEMEYNLAENLIKAENVDFLDLGQHSVLNVIQNAYKRDDVIEEIIKMRTEHTFAEKWDSFEKKLGESIMDSLPSKYFNPLIRNVVNSVGSEIYSLYWKISDDEDFRLLLKHIVLNWQDGSVNLYKTILKILDESDLLNELKFELACKYFVGKDVVKKYGKLLPRSIRNSMCCSNQHCARCIPLKFWQVYLDEDDKLDSSMSNGEERASNKRFRAEQPHNFSFYFKWALHSVNDIAVQYLWENLSPTTEDKRKCSAFTQSALFKYGTTNIIAYLISKTLSDNTIWDVENIEDGDLIMENFLRNSRWHKYIINIINASRVKIPISFVTQCTGLVAALSDSIHRKLDTFLYRDLLREFLQIIPSDDATVMARFQESKADVLYPILRVMDYEALEILMKIYKETSVLSLLDNDVGLRLYHKQMSDCAFTEIENFLKKLFKSDEILSKFLYRSIDDGFSYLCEKFIFNNNIVVLNDFSKWCGKFIPEEIVNKKMRLCFKSNGNILRQILFITDNKIENRFDYCDKFLLWSLGNQDSVNEFKKQIVLPASKLKGEKKAYFGLYFYDDFRRCVEKSEIDFLKEFLKWSGCGDDVIQTLKSQMLRDTRISKYFCENKKSAGYWSFLRWAHNETE
ncbi:UNVERIFIED_CONTAM: hypothetical protein RMT77_018343 [Armadillidium vulgare]